MKNISIIFVAMVLMFSCKDSKYISFDSEKESISSVLNKFPMIDKNLTLVRKVSLDSLSITLLQNPNKEAYDEVLVFEKKNRFYAIPFFSNMYCDYWNFENDKQPQLFPKTNSTFEKEFSNLITNLNLTEREYQKIVDELMFGILRTENKIYNKSNLLKNVVYNTSRFDKYENEESDSCLNRTNMFFDQILKEYHSKKNRIGAQYFLDEKNGRVYLIENDPKVHNTLKISIKIYRIDCYIRIHKISI
jgi:hypothetical protein